MEGADASAPSQDASGPTTSADMPIAPVYAGSFTQYNFKGNLRNVKRSLFSEQFYKKQDYGTEYRNPYVPNPVGPRGGIDVQRHMAGVGIPFADPLDNFKPGRLEIDKTPQPVRRPSRPVDQSRQRKRGTAAYRKANKDNIDAGGQY